MHEVHPTRVFVSKHYVPLWQAGSIENFKKMWLDCVEACYLAFRMGNVLHRDLNENNIMVLHQADRRVKGVVIDWDMAMFAHNQKDELLDSGHSAATLPFLARNLLEAIIMRKHAFQSPTPHYFRHNLESMFYIFVWAAIRYNIESGTRDRGCHPFLSNWTKDAVKNSNAKTMFLVYGYKQREALLEAVKPEFKQVAEELILPLRTLFRKAEFYGGESTEDDPNFPDPNATYGGYLTFKTFMRAINVTPRTWGIPNYVEDDS